MSEHISFFLQSVSHQYIGFSLGFTFQSKNQNQVRTARWTMTLYIYSIWFGSFFFSLSHHLMNLFSYRERPSFFWCGGSFNFGLPKKMVWGYIAYVYVCMYIINTTFSSFARDTKCNVCVSCCALVFFLKLQQFFRFFPCVSCAFFLTIEIFVDRCLLALLFQCPRRVHVCVPFSLSLQFSFYFTWFCLIFRAWNFRRLCVSKLVFLFGKYSFLADFAAVICLSSKESIYV